MKKCIALLILPVFLIPSITFAAWWNPFTWFKKKVGEQPSVTQQIVTAPVLVVDVPKIEEKKVTTTNPAPAKQAMPKELQKIVPAPPSNVLVTPPSTVQEIVTPQLVISDIKTTSNITSVQVEWKTSVASESKILFNGKEYLSQTGVSNLHSTEVNGLEENQSYLATITALANNAWVKEDISFKTGNYQELNIESPTDTLNGNNEPFKIVITGSPNEYVEFTISLPESIKTLKLDSKGQGIYEAQAENIRGLCSSKTVDNKCIANLAIKVQYLNSSNETSKIIKVYTGKKYINNNGRGGYPGVSA